MQQEELHRHEKLVLKALDRLGMASPEEIVEEAGIEFSSVNRAVSWLSLKGVVEVEDFEDKAIELGEEGKVYVEKGLPERRAFELLNKKGEIELKELNSILSRTEVTIALGWLKRKNLAVIDSGVLKPTDNGMKERETPDEELLLSVMKEGRLLESTLNPELKQAAELLKGRKNVIRIHEVSHRKIRLTEKGRKTIKLGIKIEDEISQLTPEIIKNGTWKNMKFRRYSINTPAPELLPAKLHPLREIVEEIRWIFLKMGFNEISGPMAESAFWNFDALFVPQDHPAREMQDTFYLSNPEKTEIPSDDIVEAVMNAHEGGWKTGSRGWRYKWSREKAMASVLRTHTTSTTIRYLAEGHELPVKVFSLGRVFRNERISFKHLPEFHQCEGIVAGDVGFSHLLGILKKFYSTMGFSQVRFRPAYFPYTEPSLEVEVFLEDKGKWMELGGAGIFRPEVTEPLDIHKPVLAWGLGLERLAMLRLGLKDIRQLYMSDLNWLRRVKVI